MIDDLDATHAPPRQTVLTLEAFLKSEWRAIGTRFASAIREGRLDIDLSRHALDHDRFLPGFALSPAWCRGADDKPFSGLRIYATGLGQSDEYQSVLLFDENGLLTDQIATTWLSAFRAALLSALAIERWRDGRKVAVGIDGLGRMGFAAAFALLRMMPVASLVVRARHGARYARYLKLLRSVSAIPVHEIDEDGCPVARALELAGDIEAAPVALFASSRADRNPHPAPGSELFILHIGSKYDGWDGPSNILPQDCNILTDSLGQLAAVRRRLTVPLEETSGKTGGLTAYLRGEWQGTSDRPFYFLSVGAPGADVALAACLRDGA
jgi:ornithine cyclodeaminase/alanine dehydrogenase-like protein (mu-crystallin family)